MARNYGRIKTSIWGDKDFQKLSESVQRTYFLLLSQPDIAVTGVIPFRPKRWAAFCSTTKSLEKPLVELERANYVVIDRSTEELLVRTFSKHDGVFTNEKLQKAFTDSVQEVQSRLILDYIYVGIPEDAPDGLRQAVRACLDDPSDRASDDPCHDLSDDPSDGHTQNDRFFEPTTNILQPTSHNQQPTTSQNATEVVFEAWKDSTGKAKARLDDKRRKLIQGALKDYPVEDVVDAVRGWRQSAYHRGENDQQTVYNELHVLLRDAARIEKFRDLERNGAPPTTGGTRMDQHMRNLALVVGSES